MKFAVKLMLSVTIVVSLLFSVGGTFFVQQNFDHALDLAANQNSNQHMLQKYAIESNMLGYLLNGETYSHDKLAEYASRLSGYAEDTEKYMGIFDEEGRSIYSTLPTLSEEIIDEAISKGSSLYLIKKTDDKTFMLFTSALEIKNAGTYMVSAYDISNLLTERNRQMNSFLLLNGILIVVSAVLIGVLAWILTRPIIKLNRASNRIAEGSYTERTGIKSNDEIGELSRSFDIMIEVIEKNIENLEDSVRQRDDFIAAFSHEIKTPMTTIVGFSDMLRTSVIDAEKQLQYANVIYSDAKRLETLSHKLMELMGISGESADLCPLSTNRLFTVVKKHAESFLGDITLECDAEPAVVMGDEAMLDCLLGNLISNAKKAHPKDEAIRLTGRCDKGRYRITVADNGCGIPQEEIGKITEPFYMVDKSRARTAGGSGLGLFLCQKIAVLHGTALAITSQLGEGTRVTLDLPLASEGGRAE